MLVQKVSNGGGLTTPSGGGLTTPLGGGLTTLSGGGLTTPLRATFQVVLDALALTPFYQAFLITAKICPKVLGQRFEKPSLEHDILSFLRDLGHSRDIHYNTNVSVDYPHQPWRAIVTIINKCLSGKDTALKSSAKVAKIDKKKQLAMMPKTKGLAVVTKVALTKVDQIKLAIKRRKKDFHMSHASGSGDRVDTQSKVLDEQQQKVFGTNKGTGVRPEVPNVPKYDSESDEECYTFSQDEDDADEETDVNDDSKETESEEEEEEEKADDEEVSSGQRVSTPPEYKLTEEENKKGKDENIEGKQEQDEKDDLYRDVNINLERSDAKMTNAQANQDTEDTHVTLTTVPLVVQQQSSSVSSDLVSKFINPSPDIVAASLSEFELKKILIEKIEENKSINISKIQKNLYNALVKSYKSDKDIITSYGDVVTLKRGRDDQDKDKDPSAGLNRWSKRRRSRKEAESSKELTHNESNSISSSKGASRSQPKSSGKSAQAKEHGQTVDDLEEQTHQEFNTGNDDVTHTVDNQPPQLWITQMAQAAGTQSSFNRFLATPINFSAFIMHCLKIDNMTQKVLIGLTYDLIKGTCKSVVELEYHLEEVFKATNDHLDWHNPEGKLYPHDFSKPIPLIQNERGRQVIPWDYFINNDLKYLKGESSSRKYTTSITKIKAADYGPKRHKFYGYASNMETSKDVDSRHRIVVVTSLKIMKYFGYSHLEEIIIRRQDDQLYKFREGEFKRLRRQDIEDMLLLFVKFSDGTLNYVRTTLNDIATGIEMDYMPKRKYSKQDKQIAHVMINAIDKKLRDRRLMRNLEKFVGERPYEGDLRLLERTI
uniref:Uncharacterized protein n=1 Tax=Tanacetum cinerariifolium TaxID=118510 RepID=A0A6L2LDK2_TANCI|nr:hypothetical protein [Tanacetum cinerariifolium]